MYAAPQQLQGIGCERSLPPSPGSACPHSLSLVQLAGLAVGVVQGELGVQVVQLAVAAQQEAAHLQAAGSGGSRWEQGRHR